MSRTFKQNDGVARHLDGVVHAYSYFRTTPQGYDQVTHCGVYLDRTNFTWLREGDVTCFACIVRGPGPLKAYFKNRNFGALYGASPKKLADVLARRR